MAGLLALACLSMTAGCARLERQPDAQPGNQSGKQSETLRGDSGRWAQEFRGPADQSKFWGIDPRSHQIEQNLGVR